MNKVRSSIVNLLVYVDDMVLTGNDSILLAKVKTFLASHFKFKNLGTLKFFLGLEVARLRWVFILISTNIHWILFEMLA